MGYTGRLADVMFRLTIPFLFLVLTPKKVAVITVVSWLLPDPWDPEAEGLNKCTNSRCVVPKIYPDLPGSNKHNTPSL